MTSKITLLFLGVLLFLCNMSLLSAQDNQCSALVQQALDLTVERCQFSGSNQACYGNSIITAESRGLNDLSFEQPGDIEPLDQLASIRLGEMNETLDGWGVAVMRAQALLPNTIPGQQVTFLVFGDVEIEPSHAAESLSLTATSIGNPNVRSGPSSNNSIIHSLRVGEMVTLNGRNEIGDWVRFTHEGRFAWVYAQLLEIEGDVLRLDVVPADAVPETVLLRATSPGDQNVRSGPSTNADIIDILDFRDKITLNGRNDAGDWVRYLRGDSFGWLFAPPLTIEGDVFRLSVVPADAVPESAPDATTAFYLRTGIGEAHCEEVPPSGVLVSTPGVGKVQFNVNGVDVALGSTAFLQAEPDGNLSVSLIEGEADISSGGSAVTITDGEGTTVELQGTQANSVPSAPAPVSIPENLPLSTLDALTGPRLTWYGQSGSDLGNFCDIGVPTHIADALKFIVEDDFNTGQPSFGRGLPGFYANAGTTVTFEIVSMPVGVMNIVASQGIVLNTPYNSPGTKVFSASSVGEYTYTFNSDLSFTVSMDFQRQAQFGMPFEVRLRCGG